MGLDDIDAIHRAEDARFYATFPDAIRNARQAEVEAEHARLFPTPPGLEYQLIDPATSWAYYGADSYYPCSPVFAAAPSPSDIGDTPPPSATSIRTSASFASPSPCSEWDSPGPDMDGERDTPPPSASTSSEPDIPMAPPPVPAPPRGRPQKRRIGHYPASPPRSSMLVALPPDTFLAGSQPLLSSVLPPLKKTKGQPRPRSGVSAGGAADPAKKPPLACLFCRGRKIACGPAVGGAQGCNQCQRRALKCEYPAESRRGMRKKKPPATPPPGTDAGTSPDAGGASAAEGEGDTKDAEGLDDADGEGEADDVVKMEIEAEEGVESLNVPAPAAPASVPVSVSTPGALTVNVNVQRTRDPRRPLAH